MQRGTPVRAEPVKRLYRSKSDIENLSKLRTFIGDEIDTFNYKGLVVNKPWGYEYLLYETPNVAAWILRINQGHSTSMHCHPKKTSAIIVLSGSVICANLEGWIERRAGECLIIDEAVFHSTRPTSEGGALVMELESPPNKTDLIRLADEYNREALGYEGEAHMSRETLDYEYVDFYGLGEPTAAMHDLAGCRLALHADLDQEALRQLSPDSANLLCLLKGKLYGWDGRTLLVPGEVLPYSETGPLREAVAIGSVSCLLIGNPSW